MKWHILILTVLLVPSFTNADLLGLSTSAVSRPDLVLDEYHNGTDPSDLAYLNFTNNRLSALQGNESILASALASERWNPTEANRAADLQAELERTRQDLAEARQANTRANLRSARVVYSDNEAALEREVDDLRRRLNDQQNEFNRREAELERKYSEQRRSYEEQLNKREEELRQMLEREQRLTRERQEESDRRFSERERQLEEEIRRVREEAQRTVDDQRKEYEERERTYKEDLEKLRHDYEEERKRERETAEDREKQLQEEIDRVKKEAEELLAKNKEELEQRLAEEQKKYEDEKAQWEEQQKDLEQKLAEAEQKQQEMDNQLQEAEQRIAEAEQRASQAELNANEQLAEAAAAGTPPAPPGAVAEESMQVQPLELPGNEYGIDPVLSSSEVASLVNAAIKEKQAAYNGPGSLNEWLMVVGGSANISMVGGITGFPTNIHYALSQPDIRSKVEAAATQKRNGAGAETVAATRQTD